MLVSIGDVDSIHHNAITNETQIGTAETDCAAMEVIVNAMENETDSLPLPLSPNHEARVSALMDALANEEDEDEDDEVDDGLGKVVVEYDMYLNNPSKRLLLLQYPNREPGQSYSDKTGNKPLELRIKPKCGLVEVDIPLSVHSNFDRHKGINFGAAMRKSQTLQEGGSYGLSGGLKTAVGLGPGPRGQPRNNDQESALEDVSQDMLLDNFEEANQKGHIMNKIILGGQIVPWKDGDPIYMIGVFRGNKVFLSKLDAMVQLRPQFNHLDALGDLDKQAVNPRSRGGAEDAAEEPQARAVNMTVKSTEVDDMDGYGDTSETARLLKAMREEPWQRLGWIDSEDDHSYRIFNDELFIQDPEAAPTLVSTMTDEQWLDAISCPRVDPINQGKKVMRRLNMDSDFSDDDDEDKNHKGRRGAKGDQSDQDNE